MTVYANMRHVVGASRAEIAARSGFSPATLGRIERGERPLYRWECSDLARGLVDAINARRADR